MRTSSVDAYAVLRRRIILGEFPPGTQLKEEALASALQVSRTPIRMAFKRLADDGLVEARPNRGVFVLPWADRDNDEVFDLRALAESHAAALAAQRRQDEHLRQLHALNERMATLLRDRPEGFLDELQQTNREFHQVVLRAAASPRLLAFVQSLLAVQRMIGAIFFYTDEQLADSLQDHRNITRAIERQDARLAGALVDSHVRGTAARLRAQRKEQGALSGPT